MTLLITGGSGYLGGELVRQAGSAALHPRLELLDPAAVLSGFEAARPSAVIHTAYRRDEPRVNADGSAAVAQAAAEIGARPIHISTDVVFDGRKRTPYSEDDEPIRSMTTAARSSRPSGACASCTPRRSSFEHHCSWVASSQVATSRPCSRRPGESVT